ncbi:MAG: DUF4446 family protein [Candidatus Levybacteria bacterium]|nr:DUF4446 family protein [Candidatus Levybacteria bacterium]
MFPLILAAIVLLVIWSIALTIILFRTKSHYDLLVKDTTGADLTTILQAIVKEMQGMKKDIALLKDQCVRIEKEGQFHIQKIGLLRFNPFKDTGGDQSFIISMLDSFDTGIVISGLYSRSGTRWYAKKVEKGTGVEHELSIEEKKAIETAKPIKK